MGATISTLSPCRGAQAEVPLEINEIAEWLSDNPARAHGDLAAVHGRGADIPSWLAVAPRGALE
jgi:hypothetical protein